MKVIWVTSFNDALYKASGRRLVNSFSRQAVGSLYVYHECKESFKDSIKVKFQSIDGHRMLREFLNNNRNVIPVQIGGDYHGCKCNVKRAQRESKINVPSSWRAHISGCPYHWFNKSVYRWFRKFVALEEAFCSIEKDSHTFVIWIDCDVWFTRSMSLVFISEQLFKGKDFFYIQGSREWPETGIFGFNLAGRGRRFFEIVRDRYTTGSFRNSERWDDCWQIMESLQENPEVTRRDILPKGYGHVFRKSILNGYLGHSKGDHGKKNVTWGWY